MPIFGRMAEKLDNDEVNIYLDEVREHVLNNLDDFKEAPATTDGVAVHAAVRASAIPISNTK